MKKEKLSRFISEEGEDLFMKAYSEAMKALPKPTKEYDIQVSFGSIRVYQWGEDLSCPLVLLPGHFSSTPMWAPNIADIAKHKTILAIDALGEPGESVQEKVIRTVRNEAAWIDETFNELNIAKGHIAGVSLGGWLACNYVIHFPGRIASLILLDPTNVFVNYSLKIIFLSLGTLPFMPDRIRRKALSKIAGGADLSENSTLSRLIGLGMKYFKIASPPTTRPTDQQLRNITIPVLVLMAGKSVVSNAHKATSKAKRLLPNVQAECWENASHAINGEFAKEVNKKMLFFIDHIESHDI